VVSDFMFAKDALFARMNLGDDDHRLYLQMHARVAHEVPEPSLVVWLQASTPALMRRIERRGIAMERHIDEGYLQRLSDAYAAYFQGYQAAPVVAVDTEDFNPVEREADFAALCERLGRLGASPTLPDRRLP
jgi:deoxyguanosine kinase